MVIKRNDDIQGNFMDSKLNRSIFFPPSVFFLFKRLYWHFIRIQENAENFHYELNEFTRFQAFRRNFTFIYLNQLLSPCAYDRVLNI